MPDYESLYPGRFLKKELLPAPKVIRIANVVATELEGDKGTEQKVTIKYKAADGEGEIVWCKHNAVLTAEALNERDYAKWVGRLITIHHDPNVKWGGKKVGGIRVCGAPDMAAPKKVTITNPRRKKNPDVYYLTPTDKKGAPIASAAKNEPSPGVVGEDIEPPIPPDDEPPMDAGDAWDR